jgi:hypothetical protein
MIYFAQFVKEEQYTGWRVFVDYSAIGGTVMSVCRAIDEFVAKGTAAAMNEAQRK